MSADDDTEHDDTEQQNDESAPEVEPTADLEPTAGVEIDKSAGGIDGSVAPWRRVKVIPLVLVLALLAAGGLAAWLYYFQYRPDEQTDAASPKRG